MVSFGGVSFKFSNKHLRHFHLGVPLPGSILVLPTDEDWRHFAYEYCLRKTMASSLMFVSYSIVISMSEFHHTPCFDPTYFTNIKIKHYVSLIQLKSILYTGNIPCKTLVVIEFFNTFKNDYTLI